MDTAKEIAQLVANVGLPGVLVLAVIYAIWQAGKWLASECIKPVVAELIQFIRHVNDNLTQMSQAVDALKTSQAEQVTALKGSACRYPLQVINPPAPSPQPAR